MSAPDSLPSVHVIPPIISPLRLLSLKCTLPPHSHLEFTLFPLSPLRFTLFTPPHVNPVYMHTPLRFTRWDFQNVAEVARAELNKFYLRNGRPH